MNGVINVYKPTGITSFDVVKNIRKLTGEKRVGHTGTLDPEASGVLPVCIGKATKIVEYLTNDTKVYKVEIKLGEVRDTFDREGSIIKTSNIGVSDDDIIKCIMSFLGDSLQVPPMYSAIKVNGKRLYELARNGIEVERKPRSITIFSIDMISISRPYVTFTVKCSKGTYIRSLSYDIGEKLGCGAVMWNLERVEAGSFSKKASIKLNELTKENIDSFIISIEDSLVNYESIKFDTIYKKLLLNGVKIKNEMIIKSIDDNKIYRVYIEDEFIGLGSKCIDGFKIIKLLN